MSYFDGIDVSLLPTPKAQPQPSRGLLRGIGDTALAFGQGAVSGVRMLTDVAGADNAASTGLRSVADYLGNLKSAQAKQDEQEIARILQEAEGAGVLDQVMAGMRAFATAPVATTAQALGSAVPTIGAALIPGVGTAALAGRAGMLAGRFAPAAVGAAQGVGSVKGSIFDATKQAYMAEDLSEEEATAKAAQAQAYSSANAGQIALGGALGAVAGGSGLESAARAMRVGATGAAPGLLRRMGTGALVEAAPEAAQGGQEKFAANTALANEGFDVNPWAGVVAAGTMEGIAGGLLGGAFGVPKPQEAAPTPVDAAKKVLEAPTLDAALDAAAKAVSAPLPAADAEPIPGIRQSLAQMDPQDRREVLGLLQTVRSRSAPDAVIEAASQRIYAIQAKYRYVPKGEATEFDAVPIGEATELVPAGDALEIDPIPAPEASEPLPTPDATEIEPIPTGDAFEEIPTPDAAEVLPTGDATEAIPTGDALDLTDPIPAPDVAEADVETIQADDLLTGDGVPYGSLTAARVRAKREGLPLENVVEIPGAGWVIRPSGPARASATVGGAPMQARPAGTRGTNAGDVIRAPAVTVGKDSERQGAVAAAPAPQAPTQGRAPMAAAPSAMAEYERGVAERRALQWADEQGKRLGLDSISAGIGRAVGGLGDVVVDIKSDPGVLPLVAEVRAEYLGRRLEWRTAEGDAAIKAAVDEYADKIQQARERMAARVMATERGLSSANVAPAPNETPALPAAQGQTGGNVGSATQDAPAVNWGTRSQARGVARHPKTVMGSRLLALVSARLRGLDPAFIAEFSTRKEINRIGRDGRRMIQWRNPLIPGVGRLFRPGGTQDFQQIAEALEEAGYLEAGSVESDYASATDRAKEMIRAALNGDEPLTVDESLAELQRNREMEDRERAEEALSEPDWFSEFDDRELEASGYTAASPEVQQATAALLAEAEAAGVDAESLAERAALQTEGQSNDVYHQALQQLAREAVAVARREAGRVEPQGTSRGGEDRGAAVEGQGGVAAEAGLTLEAQTPEALRAKAEREQAGQEAERQAKAAEQERLRREAEQRDLKARADATRDDFQLGQSADQQMSGMADLFAEPSAPAQPAAASAAPPAQRAEPSAPAPGKRADGRTIPTEGDEVFMEAAGAFGMPAIVNGTVVRGKDGLRVKITAARGMLGETTSQKFAPLTLEWTVKGEESAASRRRRDAEEKLTQQEAQRRAEYEAERTAAAERNGTLDPSKAKLGDVIETPDGRLDVVAEIDERGGLYTRPLDEGGEPPRGIGGDLRGYKYRPDVQLPADGTQLVRRNRQDQALFADGWQDVRWNEEAERFERLTPAAQPATQREAPNDQPREPAAQTVGQVSGAESQEGAGEVAPRTAKRSPDQAQTIELRKRLKVLEALRRCVG